MNRKVGDGMTNEEHELRIALDALYLDARESVASDVKAKALAALKAERERCIKYVSEFDDWDFLGNDWCDGIDLDKSKERIVEKIRQS